MTTSSADLPLRLGCMLDRDAAAVVVDVTEPSAWIVTSIARAVAGQGLVDGVVDDLVDQVVQAARVGVADVHAGPLAHGFQALEDLDL